MVTIVLSVATAAEGFTSVPALLPGIGFHAVCAVLGVHLVSRSKSARRQAPQPAEA